MILSSTKMSDGTTVNPFATIASKFKESLSAVHVTIALYSAKQHSPSCPILFNCRLRVLLIQTKGYKLIRKLSRNPHSLRLRKQVSTDTLWGLFMM